VPGSWWPPCPGRSAARAATEAECLRRWFKGSPPPAGSTRFPGEYIHHFTLLEAVAYWIWQLASAWPGILDNASGPDRRLRVTVVPDDASRWDQVLTGQSPEDAVAPEDNPDAAVAPWVAASGDSPGKLTVTILAEHARGCCCPAPT
jgi:hypothetical protein